MAREMYHVFTFMFYYPGGGMEDYVGAYNSLDEAKTVVENSLLRQNQDEGEVAILENGKLKRILIGSRVDNGSIRWTKEEE